MVSSPNGFNQNAADFERSVYTFYVGPQPTVPEFGSVVSAVLIFSMVSIIIISAKAKLQFPLK